MTRFLIPLALFAVLVAFLGIGLNLKPREVPSPLIDKPAPAFALAQLREPRKTFSPADFKGKVWLLNVWGSWCVSCRQEHPLLVELGKANVVPIVGLNWKDDRTAALKWLDQLGDPYALVVVDPDSRIAIDYGVYGAPETYVIDRAGIIRYKQIGPISPEVLTGTILPLVRKLQG
ncbi:MAG: DsbE family thiol:disulfide interchange protein [Betaproteobacteria bacterium]